MRNSTNIVEFPTQAVRNVGKRVPTPQQSPVVSYEIIRGFDNVQMRVPSTRNSSGLLIAKPTFKRGELTVEFAREENGRTPFSKGSLYTGRAELQVRTCKDGTTHTALVFYSSCLLDPVCTLGVATAKKGDKHAVAGAIISLKLTPPKL